MNLHQYLSSPGSMSLGELCLAAGIKNKDQVRQWRYGHADRRPNAQHCLAIERATNGVVRRQDLRPDDYWLIWPDLPAPASQEPA
jgi:DNA-binding transcriptional regulator YdaS (Cro superfamily)